MDLKFPGRQLFDLVFASISLLSGTALGDDASSRAYFVGNSVTDTIRYGSLAKLAGSRGHVLIWGRDMIPGAPLSWLWEHPKDGFREEPFGLYPRALSECPWDVLSLQPFDRHLDGNDGDLSMAGKFIDSALKRSPNLQIYVYSRWPRRDKAKDGSLVLDYKGKWLRKYTGGWDGTEETRDYFERVVAGLRKAYEGRAKPVLMVPVGDVLLELNERMKAGMVSGYSNIAQVYVDGIHFNNVGSYVVGTTFYATMFHDDPRGLTAEPYNEHLDPVKDRQINDKLAVAIQEAVWSVVSTHPLAGVRTALDLPGDRRQEALCCGRRPWQGSRDLGESKVGYLAIMKVTLRPEVRFDGEKRPTPEELRSLKTGRIMPTSSPTPSRRRSSWSPTESPMIERPEHPRSRRQPCNRSSCSH